jgi:hypothetical protein
MLPGGLEMFALTIFIMFMSRRIDPEKPAATRHYFNGSAPVGHVPNESEIAYWLPKSI